MKNILFICTLILLTTSIMIGQEICDNGIDDDGDLLIDLNDDDCNCPTSVPSSLIPNPSFEDRTCCPMNENELECAVSWQQASVATSDYFHTCGLTFHEWLGYRAPQPLPDGDGYVGFRDGKSSANNFKEYVGACLNATMEVGVEYRLDFFLGFPVNPNSFDNIDITMFGTTNCNNIPFGQGNQNFGCPTNGSGWFEIDHQVVSGINEWKNVVFNFVCTEPFEAIVIGPNCAIHPDVNRAPYFFVDRLTIAKSVDFEVPFAGIEGDPCGTELTIIAENNPDYTFQWYKDGIAIQDAIGSDITLQIENGNEGLYQALISNSEGCFKSEKYNLVVPIFEQSITEQICNGDTFNIQADALTSSGDYQYQYVSTLGCDSTLFLALEVLNNSNGSDFDSICIGDELIYEGLVFDMPGAYEVTLTASNGCDSIVELTVSEKLESFGTDADSLCVGDQLVYEGLVFDTSGLFNVVLTGANGCDSTVLLNLEHKFNSFGAYTDSICLGNSFLYEGLEFDQAGAYQVVLTAANGCDSIVALTLNTKEPQGEVEMQNLYEIVLGDIINIEPTYIDPAYVSFVWLDELGNVLSSNSELTDYFPLRDEMLSFEAIDEEGCFLTINIRIRITRKVDIYTPNVFSPNSDNINDRFVIRADKSIAGLDNFTVYDRWGNLVYQEGEVDILNEMQGWDGKSNGQFAAQGIYVYKAELLAFDGLIEKVTGDILLLR